MKVIRDQSQSIKSQAGKFLSTIHLLPASAPSPPGCVVNAISSKLAVYLLVKGRVDIEEEIKKAQSKVQKATLGIAKQQKTLNDPKYRLKADRALQQLEEGRLADFEAERSNYEESVKQFERLRTE